MANVFKPCFLSAIRSDPSFSGMTEEASLAFVKTGAAENIENAISQLLPPAAQLGLPERMTLYLAALQACLSG